MRGPKITIFTPIYNRAAFIDVLYSSLCEQSCKDFEWVLVDDGSTDNIQDVVKKLESLHSQSFSFKYVKKTNGGKHTAINKGVSEARGEFFLILDSDDTLPEDAIETIIDELESISFDSSVCGVSGLMAHHNGMQIGSGYPKKCINATSLELRYKYNVTGDLLEVFRTSVLREFPFPEIDGERFCPEALVWNRIAQKYSLKCFNKIVYYRDYLSGGLTDYIVSIRMKSPISSMMCYSELTKYDIPFRQKFKAAINYWRFRFCFNGHSTIPTINRFWNMVFPLALLFHLRDKKKIRR